MEMGNLTVVGLVPQGIVNDGCDHDLFAIEIGQMRFDGGHGNEEAGDSIEVIEFGGENLDRSIELSVR